MQKPLRELGRLYLGASKSNATPATTTSNEIEVDCEPRAGLPLLQVWPSDSPRRNTEETQLQEFVFPEVQENVHDSGIDSVQASPSPCSGAITATSPVVTPHSSRRPSMLHPDHARLLMHHAHHHHHHHHHQFQFAGQFNKSGILSPKRASFDENYLQKDLSPSNSTRNSSTGSLKSVPSSAVISIYSNGRRRSSRYSMFDPLDLEYALIRAAARGSVGPYSLSESLHKLTFTQSLAFPALARGLAAKQANLPDKITEPPDSGINAFAKVVTAIILVIVSILVFGVVYKFVKT